jgi:hypothetical protein
MIDASSRPPRDLDLSSLERAAYSGQADAQLLLGNLYLQGSRVVAKNDLTAARWFQMAAAQGMAAAQFNLGLMHYDGVGLPLDHVQAAGWYQLAAQQGHTGAQVNLAFMYSNGKGVAQYDAEAARLYALAAEKGHPGAQFNIGLVFANGKGVVQDLVKAHMWLSIAIASGFRQAIETRDAIELNMTDAEKDAAGRLASEWLSR